MRPFLILLASARPAAAGLFGNNLALGLAGCSTSHRLLLSRWAYNATESTVRATDATRACSQPTHCDDAWCIGIDNTLNDLPPTSGGVGAGVFLTACKKWSVHSNISTYSTAFELQDGRLRSLWAGQGKGVPGTHGLCLDSAPTGVLELAPCAAASSWSLDDATGGLSTAAAAGTAAAEPGCLVALNTTGGIPGTSLSTYSLVDCDVAPGNLLTFCDPSLPIDRRIANLLSFSYMNEMPSGFGRLGMPRSPPTGECLHGFATNCIDNDTCPTIFPDALASASSFNDTLFEAIGRTISREGRAITNVANKDPSVGVGGPLRPHTICWSPDLNPFRHPLWGRGQEVPSEDPLLCGRYGAAYIRGLQGKDDPEGNGFLRLVASPKHFVGYDMEGMGPGQHVGSTASGMTFNRHNFSNKMTAQELVEFYALPFQHAIVDGGALGMMCSYNAVEVTDGTRTTGSIPACAFTALQDGMVRGQWNFSGYIVSDCGAISDFLRLNECSGCGNAVLPCHNLCDDANYTSKCPSCSSTCINQHMYAGGTDSSCGGSGNQIGALQAGKTTKQQLIASSQRILRVLFSLGYGSPAARQPYQHLGKADVNTAKTRQLNREAARQSVVLLKNDIVAAADGKAGGTVLPLKKGQSVAVIGPIADNTNGILSNYHGSPPPRGSKYALVSPFGAFLEAGFNASYQRGGAINIHGGAIDTHHIALAVDLANDSDVAVVFVGLDAGEEHESGDRNATGAGLELPGSQQQLIQAVREVNPRTVVVLIHGSPLAIEWSKEHVPAIVDAHYPGAMGGYGVVDVLTGAFNPCSRLTTTVYSKDMVRRSIFDTGLRSDGGLTYQHYDGTTYGPTLWNFGDGMSYSNFSTAPHGTPSAVTATTAALAAGPLEFAVEVANNAGPDGCYTALGFISSQHPEAPRNKKMFDYARVSVGAGRSAVATVRLTAGAGALVGADGAKRVLPGRYTVAVGAVDFALRLTGAAVTSAPAPPLFQ